MALVLHASTTRHDEYDGPRRYIRVVVHDTTLALQRAAAAYRGQGHASWADVAGCFHPADWRELYVGGEWKRVEDPHWAGVLRLSREALDMECVAHECVHAAAAIYRMDVRARLRLGTGCGRNEETLAYIAGDLTATVTARLRAAGLQPWT